MDDPKGRPGLALIPLALQWACGLGDRRSPFLPIAKELSMSLLHRRTNAVRLSLASALVVAIASLALVPAASSVALGKDGVAGSWQITVADGTGQTQPSLG